MLSYDAIDELTEYCEKKSNITLVSKLFREATKRKIIYQINPENINDKIHYRLKLNCEQYMKLDKKYYNRVYHLEILNRSLDELQVTLGSIRKCVQLQTHDLSENELYSIPESIGNCVQLQTLNLDNNKLSSIPKSIGKVLLIIKTKCLY